MGKRLIGSVGLASSGVPDDLLTTKGDMHGFSSANARIPVGTNNYSVLADSAQALGLKWGASSTSTLTTTGDLLYASGANTLTRLGIGSTDDVLTVAGGVPTWASSGGGGAWSKAGSDIQTSYVSELEVTGITPADVYQVIYYTSDDADPTGENCRPKLQRNGGGSTYDGAFFEWTASNSDQEGDSNQDEWTLGKVSNRHSWQGIYYIFAYNGNFSNSQQDGTVIRGNGMTTAWNGIDMYGQNDATTDITSIKFFMAMDDGTVIDCNGSLQVNTLTYST